MTLKRYIHNDGQFSVAVIDATEIGKRAFRELSPAPIDLQLLTQGMAGALLLTASIKDEGTLQFQWRGNGPMEQMTVEANTAGDVRGFVGSSMNFQRDASKGLLAQAVGKGTLKVRRRIMPSAKIFESVVQLGEAEVALSLARYLLESQQIRAGIILGAKLDAETGVAGAGGVLIQALPGANDNLLFILEDRLATLPPLGEFFSCENGHERLYTHLLDDMDVKELQATETQYFCPCSRKRTLQSVAMLNLNELKEMRGEARNFEIECQFCAKSYTCSPEDLDAIIELKGAQ